MSENRLGIVGFGTTAFEFMSQGTPCLALTHYKWQEPSAVLFDELQCCHYIGCAEDGFNVEFLSAQIAKMLPNQTELNRLAQNALKIIDGKGVQRVTQLLIEFAGQKQYAELEQLYVLAHPGDEIFGCGANLLLNIQKGKNIGILFLGEGISSRFEEYTDNRISGKLEQQIKSSVQKVMERLVIKIWYTYQFKDNRFGLS